MSLRWNVFVHALRLLTTVLFTCSAIQASQASGLIGIDLGVGSSTPLNWNSTSGGSTPITLNNLMDESGALTAVDLVMSTVDGIFSSTNGSPLATQIPSHVPSLAGIEGNIFDSTDANFTFQDLNPLERYNVWVFNLDTIDGSSVDVTITGDGAPTNFTANFDANELYINGVLGDSTLGLDSYAVTVPADSTGTISVDMAEVISSSWVGVGGLAIEPVSKLIGIDHGPGNSTPTNWNTFSSTSPVTNLTNEAGDVTPVSLSAVAAGTFATSTASPPASQIPAHSQSLAGIEGNTWISGTDDATYILNNLVPYHKYRVNVLSADTLTSSTTAVTISGHGLPVEYEVSFGNSELYVNDAIGDSNRTLDSYAYTVAANSAGEILIHTVDGSSSSGDAGVAGITVTPNSALVGIDFGNPETPSPTNWNTGTASFTSATNMIDETGAQTAIDLTYTGGSLSDTTGNPPAGQFPAHGQSLADLAGNIWDSDPSTFTFSDLDPLKTYEVWVFGLDTASSTMDVTITGDGTPTNYQNTYSVNQLYANDVLGDSAKTLEDVAFQVIASINGEITIDLVDIGSYWGLAGLAIREFMPLSFDYLPGDFDEDGDVDGNDFLLWQRGGSPHPRSQSDLADWQANYGMSLPPLVDVFTAVPEPGSLALILWASALGFLRTRRS